MAPYSPERRTALVFCGTGAHGAYHAGVLRALQEAGVKIDLVAGQGIGAGTALLAAIDGGARLWDESGMWRGAAARRFYGWKPLITAVGWLAALMVLVLLLPLIVLAVGVVMFVVGFLVTLVGAVATGAALTNMYAATLQTTFAPEHLPTIVPRLAMVVLAAIVLVAALGVVIGQWRAPVRRRAEGGWWWRLLAAPLEAEAVRTAFADATWQLIRGAAPDAHPTPAAIGRRYADVLIENLGQPGFRELVLIATDLDVRADVVAALLRDPFRRDFLAPRQGHDRRAEVLDLAGPGRDHTLEVVAGAVTPPFACDPAYVTFGADSFWRGETHRLCDRPASSHRLLEEVAAAGATQVIVVSAVSTAPTPHRLRAPRLDVRRRIGDFSAAAETIALRDAIGMARLRFDSVYLITPTHNPIGAFDFDGAYDDASDRRQDLGELMHGGYEDAYRQFIEPVVGASGEHLAQASV